MGEHQERIWVTAVERYIGFDRITASSLDHSGAGEGYDYPEYVRADLYDALRAKVEAMREALAPFADVADLIDCETEGFSDDDIATLHLFDYEAARWRIGIFRTARAALAKSTGSPDDP